MRIGFIGDTHGYVPALEAVVAACQAAACDRIVHCGDFLSMPVSPDPLGETIALLRTESMSVVVGNGEVYLREWGTPRRDETRARGGGGGPILPTISCPMWQPDRRR